MTLIFTERSELIQGAQRIVVKVGSGVLAADSSGMVDSKVIRALATQLAPLRAAGREIIIVSSGAVAMGAQKLGMPCSPQDIPGKQAAAAVGQSLLIGEYQRAFTRRNIIVAQVLLTHGDLSDRQRYLNARTTLLTLLERGVIPVINENDTVAVDEIRFGDNDALSSMVAVLTEAHLLIILSDVDGLYSSNPRTDPEAEFIPVVKKVTRKISGFAGRSASTWGTGGMETKVIAAGRCTSAGISTVIVNGKKKSIIADTMEGAQEGTFFFPLKDVLSAKKRWIAHTLKIRGIIEIDAGAEHAVLKGKKSVLPAGVVHVSGGFKRGDAISCVNSDKTEVARGRTNFGAFDLGKRKGLKTSQVRDVLGYKMADEVIHKDNLVTLEE
ncbi:MAG: glutamate 5-kinase [Nitrospinota bacterium]